MRNKKIFVLKIVWRRSIASLHRLTQAVQRANLKRTAGDLTWVWNIIEEIVFFSFIKREATTPEIVRIIWHYTKISYLASKVRQKLQKLYAKYDTILRILLLRQKWGKNSRNCMQNMTLH